MKTYPLLQSQLGVFMEWMSDPSITRYNLPMYVPFSKNIPLDRLDQGLRNLIAGRRELRTHFVLDDNGLPRQYAADEVPVNIPRKKMSDEELAAYIKDGFVRPYDLLSGEPLFHIELVETPNNHVVLFDVHHTIADGTTLANNLTLKDMPAAYNGETLKEVPYGLYEYAEDEQKALQSDAYERSKAYYTERFAGREFVTLSRSAANPMGNSIHEDAYMDAEVVDAWCQANGTAANLLYMAAFSYVLAEASREDEVVYRTINHGRMDKRLIDAYGMFVKSSPVLTVIDRQQSVIEFIKSFRRELMSTIRYGSYPFSHFCRDMKMSGGVEFGFQGYKIQEYIELGGEKAFATQIDLGKSASDMTCIIYLRDGKYDIRLNSSDALNSREDLKRLAKAIKATTENMMAQPEEMLAHLSMMDAEDAKIVNAFRFTAKADVPWKLFYEPIEQNAIRFADRKALVAKDRTLTFAELNVEANKVAHALMRRGLKRDDRVVLLLPRTSAIIVSMFGVSKAGAAYIPCDPAYPSDRINLIVNDSEAPYIITTKNLASDYPAEKVILIEDIYGSQSKPQSGDEENPNVNVSPEDLAYLIYTSGSTGRPKGVMLRHIGITNYLYDHPANVHIHGLMELGVKTFVSITTLSFDMSLKEFAGSLFNGITSVLADEQEVLDASLLADLMNRTGAEAINGTCSRMLSYMELPAFCDALSHCKAVWSGGEKFPMQLLTSLQSMGVHIFNTYGPTEITVSSNIKDLTHSRKVTVGHPLLNYEEFIVDPCGNLLPVGFTGELLIGGLGVARGYNNLPEMTAERFVEYAGIRVYKSGDLARWEPDGDVEILGRNDGQVKLRGFRIELGEVENLSVKFPGIRQTVADVKDIGSTQHLCLYYVSDDSIDEDALKTFIASSLTEYMVPSVYMRIDAIPLTPNGKTNRKALPTPTLKLDEVVAPATPMEQNILQLVSDLLQLSDFGVTNNLIALGLSSLASMRLSATLKKQLGVQVLMKDIMQHPTVREIAALAEETKETVKLQPYERREWYPLNESQRGMYVDWMMNPDALQYNIPILLHLRGVDVELLKKSLIAVADAHPYMKTRLAIQGEDVVQVRNDEASVEVTTEALDHMPDRTFFQSRVRPFDLMNEPLYRFNIFTYVDHVFMLLDLHHIISDGSSNYVIAHELEKAYRGEVLTPETYTAYDRALDEEALMQSERKEEAEAWFDGLVGGIEATVYPHSSQTDGERKQGVVDAYVESHTINDFCRKQALPVSSYFLTMFHQVLHRITREENTLIYFISNGRSELLLDNFFGVLVKTLPSVCNKFRGQTSEIARSLNEQMQETIRNDFYPFTKLVERHDLKAEILYNYFVDLQTDVCLGDHHSEEIYGLDWDMAKTPLSITMLRADDGVGYIARIEYDATLYCRQDMETLGNAFKAMSESCCTAAGNELAGCRIVLPDAYNQLLQLSKGEQLDFDPNDTFVSLFVQRAAEAPDAIAVVDEEGSYTYGQLDQLSNALAAELRHLGVGADNTASPFVSIMLGYEKAFLVAAIGIEKAGGAYVPLDYEYPNDRLLYMLEDSESQVLVTSHAILNEKTSGGDKFEAKNIFFIDDFLKSEKSAAPVNFATPNGLAYMIYTSGSTGKPKGVMIPHRAKANFVHFIAKEWRLSKQSRICCHSSFSFDASIEDLYPVLTVGGTLYTVPREARKDLTLLHDFIVNNKITGGCYTTQLGLMLLQQFPDLPVDYLVVGGEKMADNPSCNTRLINTYGPTEFTVDATFYETKHGRHYKNIPIGRPLHNLSAFVLDPVGQLVPQGVAGELCMAGPQIACGYWHREELTAQKFVDCPFADGKMYHTGDLVKYNEDGDIEYMGRIDNQIKLRGFRIELGEIESLISKYEGVQMQSVQVKEIGGVQHLCAYYSADRQIDADALRHYLAEQLTDYMVPTAYMQLDHMPLTPNGKVNTKALPMPNVQADELVAPVTKTEKKLFALAAEMLKHDKFGITSNLITMGLTSLTAMRFTVAAFNEFKVQVTVKDVMQHPTIHQMAALIDSKREEEGPHSLQEDTQFWPEGKHYYYPITENQRGVLFDWEMNRNTTQYNVPEVHVFKGGNAEKLRDALIKVVNAHPYLKTRFVQHQGDVMQIRRDKEPVRVLMETLSKTPDTAFFQNRVRPFDLYHDILYRLEVYTYENNVYLFIDIHHSIYDGASSLFLLSDIQKAYQGVEVEQETYTAFDFALDELRLTKSEKYAEAEQYFKNLLDGRTTAIYPHSNDQKDSSKNSRVSLAIKAQDITAFCHQQALTPNNYFLTVLMHVLHAVTREENIAITTINNGRSDVRMMGIMGMFVKTLPVASCSADGSLNVAHAVKNIQEQLLETQSRHFYPFTKMVELYGLRPEIMYVYQPKEADESSELNSIRLTLNQSKLPLTVTIIPEGHAYTLELEYESSLYSQKAMLQLGAMLKQISEHACSAAKLNDVALLNEAATAQIINISSGKYLDVDITKTFAHAFEERAKLVPHNVAVADKTGHLTYSQLSRFSNVLAQKLIAAGVQRGDFVCVMLDRTKEFPLSVLAIHKAGAAYTPLDFEYPNQRLLYMLENSQSKVLITTHAVLDSKRAARPVVACYRRDARMGPFHTASAQVIFIDDIDFNVDAEPVNLTTPDNLAYMIYTSGSTGKPKGAMLHQAGLWNFINVVIDMEHLTADDRIEGHRSFSFDAHIEDMYAILTLGGSFHIMPTEIRKDLAAIRDFLFEHQITGGGYSTAIAALLLNTYDDLPVRFITAGGEKLDGVYSDHIEIINVYGPTECTDDTSYYKIAPGKRIDNIPIGKSVANNYNFIIDPQGRLLPQGIPGELCFAGIQVGRGYWQLPERTAQAFCDCPFVKNDAYDRPVRMYHTGDVCRWNEQGDIEYLGRIDFQVKLRGFRIELGEIENKVLIIDGIRQAAAEVRKVSGADHLVLYYTLQEGSTLTDEQIRRNLQASSLAEYMVPDTYMQLPSMPLTPNGKINRKALPVPEIKAEDIVAPATETEQKMWDIVSELLKVESFGVTTNLISIGLTSLTAMRLSARLSQSLQLTIPTNKILTHPTIRELAASEGQAAEQEVKVWEKRDYYPITENQRGVYIDWELNRDTTQYNLPTVTKMAGVDAEQLRDALVKIVEAHPYLKTRLAMKGDDIVQLRLDDEPVVVELTELNEEPTAEFFRSRVRPFNLFNDRLYRMEVYKTPTTVWYFQDIHHIVFDGASDFVLRAELEKALHGEALQREDYSAFERALDEKELMESATFSEIEKYFDGLLEDVEMISYPHSNELDGAEGVNNAYVTADVDKKVIDEYCRKNSATANSFFLTSLMQVLHRLTREERIAITTISNGRSDTRMHTIMGMFVKTLPIVSRLDGNQTFADALVSMNQQVITSIGNDIYPFTKIAERYKFRSEIMFVFQGGMNTPVVKQHEETMPLDLDTTKMPIAFMVTENAEGTYHIELEYDTHLYSQADMQILVKALQTFIQQVLSGNKQIKAISLTDKEEQARIISLSQGEQLDYDQSQTFVDMVCSFATSNPDAIAVVDKSSKITYQELDKRSNTLAAKLIEEGVQPDTYVGIMLPRQKEFIVALLSVMKAGAAYIPMDHEYPIDRLLYMLEDSRAKVLITTHDLYEAKQQERLRVGEQESSGMGHFKAQQVIFMDESIELSEKTVNLTHPDGLAYMIYTSGSTGKPKGVMLPHRALRAYLAWRIEKIGITPESRHIEHPSFSFDASLDDLLCPLAAGGRVYILPEELRKDMDGIYQYVKDNHITGMTLSTALGMTMLNQYSDLPVKYIMMGGEKMLPFPKTPIKVINGYGPTEFSVCSSFHVVDQDKDENIPIGRPVPNSWSFICDTFGNLLPLGCAGELCLCGAQMSNGYWQREDLTKEKFCVAPFGMKVYHTGDLACWNEQGELEFLGRIDNQVKLRGFRIELGEIENQASLIEGIKAVAAEVREAGGSKHLVLYFTATSEMNVEMIRERLSETLTEYMVPDTYMQLDEMPLTPNGKVNRKALPEPIIRSAAEYVEPATETERIIAQTMQEVLAIEQPIGALDSFFAWGGDSIKSIRLVSKLRTAGIALQVADIMKLKTVRNIAAACMDTVITIDQLAWSGEVPQSAITRFFFDLSLPQPHHFNQTMFIKANQRIQVKAMEDTIKALTEHHDMLRSIIRDESLYVRDAGEPNLYDWEELDFSKDDAYVSHIEEICRHRQSHINLNNGPLLKVTLFHAPDYDALLMVCHHIIVDGVSWRVLLEDLNTGYTQAVNGQAITLPEKTHSYKTYAEALQKYASSYELQQEIPYWNAVQEKLTKLPNSNTKDYGRKFSMINTRLDSTTTHAITTNAGEAYGADVNDLLMTALGRSYYQLTGKDAVSVQFEGHGREYIGEKQLLTDRTVGWFTSVYPVVLEELDGDLRSCLRHSKETMHRIPNKGVGYNILRFFNEDVHYDTNKCALIGFNYLGEMDGKGNEDAAFSAMTEISCGEDFSPLNVFGPDLSINCSVVNGELAASLAYNNKMYTEEQAQKLLNGMMSALQEITAHTATKDKEVTATDLGEYEWSDEDFQKIYNTFAAKGTPLQRIYPLSPMQEGIMLKFMLEPDSLAYRLVSRMALDVVPTEEQLRYALDQLAAKHEVLRTSIIYRDTELYRQAIVDRKLGLEMRDITSSDDKERAMVAMYKAEQQRGFDMEYDPLFRIVCVKTSENTSEILLAVHHIIVDGWCIGLFMNDLILNLTDAMQGNMRPIEYGQAGRYERFIRELMKKDKQKGLDYWKKLLEGYTTKAVIPSTGIVPEKERATDNVCHLKLSSDEMQALNALSASLQVTTNTIVELAWSFVLQAYNRQNDVVFVKVVSGRNNASEGVEDVVGLFINSVPVRVTMQKGTTISQALQALQQQAAETNEWDYCPLSVIQQQSDLNGDLFQSIVAFENYESNRNDNDNEAPFHVKMIYSKEESINDITITAYESSEDGLEVNVEFDNKLYHRHEIEHVAVVMKHMLKTIIRHPDVDVCNIIPLGKKDTLELVQLGKGETLNFDTSKTLVDLFTEQAQKTPDDTCIVFQNVRLTYREVDQITDRLALLLQKEYDVQSEMAVGVMIDRSELMLIYPMAIMKAGAAYMPLDFHFPEDRLTFMYKDAGVRLILSEDNRVEEAIPAFGGKVIKRDVLDKLHTVKGKLNKQWTPKPENMFVILYTSGSTGTPKGVVLEHRNIVNFCHWYVDAFKVTAQDRAVAYANFGFDAHMMDIYPVISVGGSVYIIPSDMRMDLMAMNEYMEKEQLNLAFLTTQVGYMFATTIENRSLRLLSVGGEKLQPLAKPAFDFYNGYGPTECTLYSTYFDIEKDYDCSYIGRPLANYQLYVVDQNLNLVPRGAAGELVVAGAGVGRGYLNRPETNAEKFITFMGQKAYRTGDLVRWSPDGNIDFIGRMDGQVKLRGLRIELGEIEARASKYPEIKSVAVDVKEICGAQHICCYFTADTEIDIERLKDFLREKLTDYMVPTAYTQMDKLPLTPNGKVNRRALPIPTIVVHTENVPPQNEKETILYNIACELLKTNEFGVTDDLTQMGLTSLLCIKLVMMASKKDIMIKLDDVMKLKNIRAVLQNNMSMVSWAQGYSADKPIVVLVCGATPYKDMTPYVEELSKNYSVLVFEPIAEHYDYIFMDADINEVVEMYYAMLDINIPEGTPIAAFTGHCFGGEIAYRLAIKREQETGHKSPMIMLDVFWRIEPLVFDEDALMKLIPQELVDKYGSGIRSYTKAMHMYDSLGRKGVPPLYDGEVVLFRATETEPDNPAMAEIYAAAPEFKEAWKHVIEERSMDNRAFWTQYYPQMEVYDMTAHHMSMLEKQHVTKYVEWLDKKVKN